MSLNRCTYEHEDTFTEKRDVPAKLYKKTLSTDGKRGKKSVYRWSVSER